MNPFKLIRQIYDAFREEEDVFMKFTAGFILISVIFLLFLFTVGIWFGVNGSPGTGSKIGQIVKVSRVGIFRKTWECELIRGGFTDGSGIIGAAPFHFTVESEAMAESVKAMMDSQSEVIVSYRVEGVYLVFRSGSAGTFATDLKRKE